VLYQQYLTLMPVLGRFVREPFGAVPPSVAPPRLDGPLPRAMGLGIAHPDPDQVAVVVHDLGAVVFKRGWLGDLWADLLSDAPRRLGTAGLGLRRDPWQLLSDEATSPTSALRTWAGAVTTDGVSGAAGEAMWRRAHEALLARGPDELSTALFGTVEVIGQSGHGVAGRLTSNTFLTQLTDAVGDRHAQYFSSALFDAAAVSQEAHRVAETVMIGGRAPTGPAEHGMPAVRWLSPAHGERADLDQFVVIVQTTAPLPSSALRLLAPLVATPATGGHEPARDADPSFPEFGI
jgi:hypothetical protein